MHKTIFQTEVTFLKHKKSKSVDRCTLASLLLSDKWRSEVEAIRQEQDPEKQKAMKAEMPCFTASGVFRSPVNAKNLIAHSGYICIDLDEKDNADVENFASVKDEIHKIPYVAYCGRSIRGKGFFCLIPIKDPAKHGLYFKALQRDFKACGLTIDPSCRDVCRKRFVSYDPDPYVNTAAKVYDYVIAEHQKAVEAYASMTDEETRRKVESLINEIRKNHADITETRDAWFECLCALAKQFGEDGRKYAHAVSENYPGYTYEETDAKFDDALRHEGYGYTIGSLFYHAQQVTRSAQYDFKDVGQRINPDDSEL